jgi:hypothetical protein
VYIDNASTELDFDQYSEFSAHVIENVDPKRFISGVAAYAAKNSKPEILVRSRPFSTMWLSKDSSPA